MAPRSKDVPASEYQKDFYSWLTQQARLVREGRWETVDRETLAKEIEQLAEQQFSKLESVLHGLLMHLLKWDHQAIRRSRGRSQSIQSQREAVKEVLARNPGLKARMPDALARSFRSARADVAQETALDEGSFPASCPYDWDEIVAREFSV